MFKTPDVYNRPFVALFVSCYDVNFRVVFTLFMRGLFEPRCEKTGLRGFRPGPTQTRLRSDRGWLEA